MSIQLFNGDCLEEMAKLADGSVDLVLTDPPYGTTSCKWDSVIPISEMWKAIDRVLKPYGTAVLFGSEPFSTSLRAGNLAEYKYDWIWHKPTVTNFVHAKNMPLKDYEIISVFSKGSMGHKNLLGDKRMTYNPQGLVKADYSIVRSISRKSDGIPYERPSWKAEYEQEFTNYPRQTLEYAKDPDNLHPSQKPVALLEYLILTYSERGGTVLDFTMGSGSTGVACVNTDRDFIGIELDEKYFGIAKQRIADSETERKEWLF